MGKPDNPFRYFNCSPEVIRLVVMMYVRFPLSLRNVDRPSPLDRKPIKRGLFGPTAAKFAVEEGRNGDYSIALPPVEPLSYL